MLRNISHYSHILKRVCSGEESVGHKYRSQDYYNYPSFSSINWPIRSHMGSDNTGYSM